MQSWVDIFAVDLMIIIIMAIMIIIMIIMACRQNSDLLYFFSRFHLRIIIR